MKTAKETAEHQLVKEPTMPSEQPESIADRVSREIIALLPPGNMVEPLLRQAARLAKQAIEKLDRDLEREERDHLDTIDHRDKHEERINAIVRECGLGEYESSWTSHNDPSHRAIEYINSLEAKNAELRAEVERLNSLTSPADHDSDLLTDADAEQLRRDLDAQLGPSPAAADEPIVVHGREVNVQSKWLGGDPPFVVTDGNLECLDERGDWSDILHEEKIFSTHESATEFARACASK